MQRSDKIEKYYLYLHKRNDNKEIFYVGIGSIDKKFPYKRAYNKNKRNKFWKNITNKTDYIVEIVLESNDREFICQKEIEYISKYGRRDLGIGTLVNLTSGEDANFEMSKQSIDQIVKTKIENGSYERLSELMKVKMIDNQNGINDNKIGKEIFVYYAKTGEFYKSFISIHKCHRELIKSKSISRLQEIIKNNGTYKGYMFFFEYKGKITKSREIKPIKNKRKVICVNNNITFDSISDAARSINGTVSGIKSSIIKNNNYKNYTFKFI